MLASELHNSHANKLEWIIIILIMIEASQPLIGALAVPWRLYASQIASMSTPTPM